MGVTIGAGAVVVKDVEEGCTVAGDPAKSFHIRNQDASFGENGIVNGINIIKNESTNICYSSRI